MRIDKYIAQLRSNNIIVTVHDSQLAINDPDNKLTPEVIDELKERKSEVLNFFEARMNRKSIKPIPRAPEQQYYPLSSTQSRMHFLHQFDPHSTAYNTPMAFELHGTIDANKLENSIYSLVERHESLRTIFKVIDREAVQEIRDGKDFIIGYEEMSKEQFEASFDDFIHPFDLSSEYPIRVSLIKLSKEEHVLFLDIHHIVSDLASMNILIGDLIANYNNMTLPELTLHYKDYAVWQQSEVQQKELDAHKEFWLNEFAEATQPLELPTSFERPLNKTFKGDTFGFVLNEDLTNGLRTLSNDLGTTLFMSLFAVYNVLLSKLSNSDDITIGTPVSGRQHPDLEGIMGMFVNTLPMRNRISQDSTIKEFMLSIKEKVLTSLNHQFYRYEDLIDELSLTRDASRTPLFDVMFVFQNAEIAKYESSDLTIKNYPYTTNTSKFDLTLSCTEEDNKIQCSFEYYSEIFDAQIIQNFANYFSHLVSQVVQTSDGKLKDLALLKRSEQEKLLYKFNDTYKTYKSETTIHKLFEEQVENTPDAVAVAFNGFSMSYKELNKRSNHLARILKGKGVEANTVVGIMQKRSIDTIISILAILKAGGAYLPIDSEFPLDRIEKIIEDSQINLLLTNLELSNNAYECLECIHVGQVDYTMLAEENVENSNSSSDLLYVIYTSGTTGVPKGAMVNHRNLLNLMDHHISCSKIDTTAVLQFTTLTFDPSFLEIFSPLLTGGTVHLVDEITARDFSKLMKHIQDNDIRTMFMPSSVLNQIFNSEQYLDDVPSTLRNIVTAGEQVIVGDLFKKYLKQNNVYLHNHYGPAETHVVTGQKIDPKIEIPTKPSIGKPIQNTYAYILDSGMQQQPINVPGELYVGGDQLGNGYLFNPKLTNERFVNNPFKTNDTLYRTGDLAKWTSEGNIEFLGRVDDQIKLNGVRIEPGEISSKLNALEMVSESVATVVDIRDEKALVAYYVSKEPIPASVFRAYLIDKLPMTMIPNYFVHLKELPTTATGKLYRKALPIPEVSIGLDFQLPFNETEEKLVEIWSEILKLDRDQISVNRSFFELGGQSLKAVALANSIFKEFSVEISIKQIFVKQTITDLSNYIITVKQLDAEEQIENLERTELLL